MRMVAKALLTLVFFLLLASGTDATAGTVSSISCIASNSSGTSPALCTTGILATSTITSQTLLIAGFYVPADGGGGEFEQIPSCPASSPTGNATAGSRQVALTGTLPAPPALGSLVNDTASGTIIPKNDQVVSYAGSTLTLSEPALLTTSVTLSIVGNNGGSLLQDGAGHCFTRVNSTWSPKEWGAYEDYNPSTSSGDDDADALQRWLNAPQPHIAVPGNSKIAHHLDCWDGGVIQGSPTQAVAEDNTILPTFTITAAPGSGFTDTTAMLMMQQSYGIGSNATPARCAIHGVGLIGDGTGSYDIVRAMGKSDLIDGHSYLSGGCYDLNTQSPGANVEIYDSSLNTSYSDNASIGSPNVKLVRNSFAGAGTGYGGSTCYAGMGPTVTANNITFSGLDVVIADNIIQQARGWGIVANGARLMRMTGNFFDNDGKGVAGTGAIDINNSANITLCGNTFYRNGVAAASATPPGISSHVYFEGQDDSISLCGNVYLPGHTSGSAGTPARSSTLRPLYDYDANPAAQLSNITIADNPGPQDQNTGGALPGVLSPNAQTLLASALNPQTPKNYLSGLTLSNASSSASPIVNITAGEATDSLGTTILKTSGCPVNVTGTPGLGGPDKPITFPATVYYFIVSGANGTTPSPTTNPNCMASASLTPSFKNVTAYQIVQNGRTAPNSSTIFNVGMQYTDIYSDGLSNPLAGMAVGDVITDASGSSNIPDGTVITSLKSFYAQYCSSGCVNAAPISITPAMTGNTATVQFSPTTDISRIAPGMMVDGTASGNEIIETGAYVETVCLTPGSCVSSVMSGSCSTSLGPCIVLDAVSNPAASMGCSSSCAINFGGNFTITLSNPVSSMAPTTSLISFKVRPGLYRLVGALYTDASGNVVGFHQDGDTFYLNTPVRDIPAPTCLTITITASTCLLSVPCGRSVATCGTGQAVAVEALGRLASLGTSNQILISSLDQTDQIPAVFTSAPGNTSTSSATTDAYPFRVYTSADPAKTSGAVRLRSNNTMGGITVNEVTDGWVFHRAQ